MTPGSHRAAGAAAGAIGLWSLNALAAGAVLDVLSVAQVLALQFGGAFVALAVARAVAARRMRERSRERAPVAARRRRIGPRDAAVAVVGLGGTIGLQYVAFASAPLVAANAIAYAWPLLAAIWSALAPGARGSQRSLAFALTGFGGVVLLFAARGGGGGAQDGAPLLGYAAALGSATAMAGYTLTAGGVRASTTDLLLAGTGAGAAVAIPVAVLEGAPWTPAWAVALAGGIGVAMLAVGYGLWTRAMADPAGARLAPAAYATPLLSTGLLLAGGARLPLAGLAGCGLILLCTAGVVVDALLRGRRLLTGGGRSPGAGSRWCPRRSA